MWVVQWCRNDAAPSGEDASCTRTSQPPSAGSGLRCRRSSPALTHRRSRQPRNGCRSPTRREPLGQRRREVLDDVRARQHRPGSSVRARGSRARTSRRRNQLAGGGRRRPAGAVPVVLARRRCARRPVRHEDRVRSHRPRTWCADRRALDRAAHGVSGVGVGVAPLRSRRGRHADVPCPDAGGSPPSTPHARLDRTSALAAGLESAAFVAGPALGGLLLLVDTTDSLLVCAAMMVVSAAIASFLKIAEVVNRPIEGRSRRILRDAGRCLLGPGIRPAIVAVVGVDVLSGLMATLLVRHTGRARFGRRTRLRTAFVRFRAGCVRRVHRPPPTHPAGATTRPAPHRRCGSRRARRDGHAARGAGGVLRPGCLGARR